jgi:hypothetical protein
MDDTLNKEENSKNIYVIRHKLGELKKMPGCSHYEWQIGPFVVKMLEDRPEDHPIGTLELVSVRPKRPEFLTQREKVDVQLYERSKKDDQVLDQFININSDSRFKNYKPIMYNTYQSPTGNTISFGDGRDMPMLQLCELIRYLHRLANLTAFM